MPRTNTVTPFGDFVATPAHGNMMGNRGILHDDDREIVRQYAGKRWVACSLALKPRAKKRPLMDPGHYTVLFFLDEATALAAGHRPCWTCRRQEYDAFLRCWSIGSGLPRDTRVAPEHVDATLHRERTQRGGGKLTYQARIDTLPDGCMIDIDGTAHLIEARHLLQWTPAGYATKTERPLGTTVTVLTPASIVNALNAGYVPEIHHSATAL